MEQSQKSYLFSRIKELTAKREKHEKKIQNLLQNKQSLIHQCPSASRSSNTKMVEQEWNQNEDYDNVLNTERSITSCSSSLSRQVNLDVYLTTKPQISGEESTQLFVQNNLQAGLKLAYGQVKFIIEPYEAILSRNSMISENLIDFEIIVNFFQKNQLWSEVFVKKQEGYCACICEEFNSHCINFVNLSKQKLSPKQMSLVIEYRDSQIDNMMNENDVTAKKQIQGKAVFIGYLLLYRLMSYFGTDYAPEIMQSLFGYPFQTFNIQITTQYIALYQTLNLHSREPTKVIIMGQNSMLHRMEEIQFINQQNDIQLWLTKFLKLYNKVIIIYLKDGLCCKSIDIIHRRNHHSVVDLQNNDNREVKVYMTFFSNKINDKKCKEKQVSNFSSKCSISHGFCEHLSEQTLYRFCLINQSNSIVSFSSPFQPNRQAVQLKLAANSEYKLYISEISSNIKENLEELCFFQINFHSQGSLENFSSEIKFDECYNTMTFTLINKYLKDFSNIDEVEKEMIRLSEANPSSDILIVRTHLKLMGLTTDFISVREHIRRMGRNIYIEYQDKEVLCDQYYRENRKKLTIAIPEIYQIFLSKNSPLKSCSGFTHSLAQIFL